MSNINPNPFTTRPEIEGTFGVVTSTHWIATAVGMATLEKGGNAFDAAVATAFTLQVVEPHLNGPGGDVPVILYDVRKGSAEVICGQGPAPAGATIAHYRSLGLDMVPGTGLLAACVPGMFDTWMMLLRDYGTMRLADVLAPAISYAQRRPSAGRARQRHHRDGREAVPRALADLGRGLSAAAARCRRPARCSPTRRSPRPTRACCARPRAPAAIASARSSEARKVWSQGFVAEAIDRFCRTQEVMDTSGERAPRRAHRRGHGALAGHRRGAADLRLRPLHRVQAAAVGAGTGDAAAARAAQGLRPRRPRRRPSRSSSTSWSNAPSSPIADREKFYGDPDFVEVPIATLLSDAYNDERRKLVRDNASLELRPGLGRGLRRGGQAQAREGASAAPSAAWAPASRPSAASAKCAATPCISTSSTRPATWCRRRRPAAGCNPRR